MLIKFIDLRSLVVVSTLPVNVFASVPTFDGVLDLKFWNAWRFLEIWCLKHCFSSICCCCDCNTIPDKKKLKAHLGSLFGGMSTSQGSQSSNEVRSWSLSTHCQEAGREECCLHFTHAGTPALRIVQPTCSMCGSSHLNQPSLENPSQICPKIYLLGNSRFCHFGNRY